MELTVISTNATDLALILSYMIVALTLLMLALIAIVRRHVGARIGNVYVGGEDVRILSRQQPSVLSLYWGFVSKAMKNTYILLRESIHTGKLSDWTIYMALWYIVLLVIAIIALVFGGI